MTVAAPSSSSSSSSSSPLPDFTMAPFTESTLGWGPSSSSLPLHLLGLPFMPFNKSERLTRISDWLYPRGADGARAHNSSATPVRAEDDDVAGIGASALQDASNPNVNPSSSSSSSSSPSSSSSSSSSALASGADDGGAFSLVDTKSKSRMHGGYRNNQRNRQQNNPSSSSSSSSSSSTQIAPAARGTKSAPTGLASALSSSSSRSSSSSSSSSSAANAASNAAAANKGVSSSSSPSSSSSSSSPSWNAMANASNSASGGAQWSAGSSTKRGPSSSSSSSSSTSSLSSSSRTSTGPERTRANAANTPGNANGYRRYMTFEIKEKEQSVEIRDDFKLELDIELSELTGVTFEPPRAPMQLSMAGQLLPYNSQFARVTPRTPLTLSRFDSRQFFAASTSEDPILLGHVASRTGTVYATDSILSLLMACPRSIYAWDLLLRVTAEGELIFDKRAESRIDYLSVNENATSELLQKEREGDLEAIDSINHPLALSLEATLINHNFSQQALASSSSAAQPPITFPTPNPFLSSLQPGQEPAALAYRYVKLDLGPGLQIVTRSSVNAYSTKNNKPLIVDEKTTTKKKKSGDDEDDEEDEEEEEEEEEEEDDLASRLQAQVNLVQTHVLNEYDPRLSGAVDWKQKLDSQTGAILAIEMKKNSYKLSRFISQALIANVDQVKLGFVTRFNSKSISKHLVLLSKDYTPQTLAESVNIKTKTLWGSLKVLLSKLQTLEAGEYLLVRDANKPMLKIFSIPPNAFDESAAPAPASGDGAVKTELSAIQE